MSCTRWVRSFSRSGPRVWQSSGSSTWCTRCGLWWTGWSPSISEACSSKEILIPSWQARWSRESTWESTSDEPAVDPGAVRILRKLPGAVWNLVGNRRGRDRGGHRLQRGGENHFLESRVWGGSRPAHRGPLRRRAGGRPTRSRARRPRRGHGPGGAEDLPKPLGRGEPEDRGLSPTPGAVDHRAHL